MERKELYFSQLHKLAAAGLGLLDGSKPPEWWISASRHTRRTMENEAIRNNSSRLDVADALEKLLGLMSSKT